MNKMAIVFPVLSRWLALLVVAGILTAFLSACGASGASQTSLSMASMAQMPEEVRQSAAPVLESYRFAVANPDVLKQIPCYCGCGAAGHASNYACYVKSVNSSGEVTFDSHAQVCSICVDITQDTMRLLRQGKTVREVRVYIDQTYAKYGLSNMPPVTP